ncbi:MAG: hypothetical protein ACLTXE_17995 [Enterocloster aldenensis]|uniref:hypothetical protein n=1 Tax=Enterocloster bolteae TaxID=208479 RepID=UPI0027B97FAE|nr:hypothetical protein [Enterocloster bolteae]
MSVSITPEAYPYLAIIAVVVVMIFIGINAASKSSKKKSKARQEKYQELKDLGIKFQYTLSLFSGLKIPEHTACKVSIYEDSLSIEANGVKYVLKNDRIKDVCAKTDIEIQKHYVSSAGGAVGGAVLFGAVGAMIGGRVKEKTDRNIRNYLIVTYDKDGEPDYIAFDVTGNPEASKRLIDEYKGKTTQSVIEL